MCVRPDPGTSMWGSSSPAALTQWFITTINSPKNMLCNLGMHVCASGPGHLTASRRTPVPPALTSMASRGGEAACGEFPASLVLVSNLLLGRNTDGQHIQYIVRSCRQAGGGASSHISTILFVGVAHHSPFHTHAPCGSGQIKHEREPSFDLYYRGRCLWI